MHTAFLIIDLETYWTGVKVKNTLRTESSASYIKDKKICIEINQDIYICTQNQDREIKILFLKSSTTYLKHSEE